MTDLEKSVVNSSFDEWLSSQTGTIDIDCGCVSTEAFYYWLRKAHAAKPVIPDGWKLVPMEPTDRMIDAYESNCWADPGQLSISGYQAMLDESPNPE